MNTIFVIFGATGDLMKRKLIPAFECLNGEKKLKGDFEVIGVGRTKLSKSKFQKKVEKAVKEFGKIKDKKLINKFSYHIIGYENLEDYKKLEKLISSKTKSGDQVIYYLSVPPNIFPDVLKNIKESGLNKQKKTTKKIAFEKPFGTNLQTAKMLNKEINEVFEEKYVYRIDHYLGKEAIQNFLVLRFA
ncbi:MAG: glucose-6-phosphate dehydrogenase, partial [Nanoarchaeota archaeon]